MHQDFRCCSGWQNSIAGKGHSSVANWVGPASGDHAMSFLLSRSSAGAFMKFAISAFIAILLLGLPARAQVAGGAVTGTITAESGAAIPDVRVSVKDVSTGLVRTTATNSAGLFGVPDLAPG